MAKMNSTRMEQPEAVSLDFLGDDALAGFRLDRLEVEPPSQDRRRARQQRIERDQAERSQPPGRQRLAPRQVGQEPGRSD